MANRGIFYDERENQAREEKRPGLTPDAMAYLFVRFCDSCVRALFLQAGDLEVEFTLYFQVQRHPQSLIANKNDKF